MTPLQGARYSHLVEVCLARRKTKPLLQKYLMLHSEKDVRGHGYALSFDNCYIGLWCYVSWVCFASWIFNCSDLLLWTVVAILLHFRELGFFCSVVGWRWMIFSWVINTVDSTALLVFSALLSSSRENANNILWNPELPRNIFSKDAKVMFHGKQGNPGNRLWELKPYRCAYKTSTGTFTTETRPALISSSDVDPPCLGSPHLAESMIPPDAR